LTDISPTRHLSKRSRALYRPIQSDYELGDHHIRLHRRWLDVGDAQRGGRAGVHGPDTGRSRRRGHLLAPDMGAGAVESTDGGRSWTVLGGVSGAMWVSWDPKDTDHAIVTNQGAAAESTDGGETWNHLEIPNGAWMVELDPSDPKRLYAAVHQAPNAIAWVSRDGERRGRGPRSGGLRRCRSRSRSWPGGPRRGESLRLPPAARVPLLLHRRGRAISSGGTLAADSIARVRPHRDLESPQA
jgi:hypothetical protein